MSTLARSEFDRRLDSLLRNAESLIPTEMLPDLPYMEQAPDVHEWYPFEMELWNTGEQIRLFLAENDRKMNAAQLDRIIRICLDKKAKRGRLSFVMLLGRKKYGSLANSIVSLLHDPNVDGHVIDTLYKMGAGQYPELVSPFLHHKKTWIRNVAKKYLQKFE